MRWRILNPGAEAVTIHGAWLPHSRFRGQELELSPPVTVQPSRHIELPSTVVWREPPGAVVQNAFLILRLASGRLFGRLRVTSGEQGQPNATCETVTAG